MPDEDLRSHSHLWDGSDPGWTLHATRRHERRLTLHFGAAGPSIHDVAAMRAVFTALGERTPKSVWDEVRGKSLVAIDGVYSPVDAPRLVKAARERGLRLEVSRAETVSYLPYNEITTRAHLICDAALAAAVVRRMIDERVPVRWTEVD